MPGQYTLLRTPANEFFPPEEFAQLESRLLQFGQERLGCGNISPVWLSNYVHGCRQEMHADLPHGPWAFVLSVTPEPRKFTGGETFILRPHVLDYWCGHTPGNFTALLSLQLALRSTIAASLLRYGDREMTREIVTQ